MVTQEKQLNFLPDTPPAFKKPRSILKQSSSLSIETPKRSPQNGKQTAFIFPTAVDNSNTMSEMQKQLENQMQKMQDMFAAKLKKIKQKNK